MQGRRKSEQLSAEKISLWEKKFSLLRVKVQFFILAVDLIWRKDFASQSRPEQMCDSDHLSEVRSLSSANQR